MTRHTYVPGNWANECSVEGCGVSWFEQVHRVYDGISLDDCNGDEELFAKVCDLALRAWEDGYNSALHGCPECPKEEN